MINTGVAQQEDLFSGMRALTVEDEGITQMQLAKILRGAGIEQIGLATSGPQGVAIALKERPNIILMDINMPGEYNGLEAARRILAEYRACIVMLTAYADYMDQAAEIGVCGYVIKPLDRATLLHHLRKALAAFEERQA